MLNDAGEGEIGWGSADNVSLVGYEVWSLGGESWKKCHDNLSRESVVRVRLGSVKSDMLKERTLGKFRLY